MDSTIDYRDADGADAQRIWSIANKPAQGPNVSVIDATAASRSSEAILSLIRGSYALIHHVVDEWVGWQSRGTASNFGSARECMLYCFVIFMCAGVIIAFALA